MNLIRPIDLSLGDAERLLLAKEKAYEVEQVHWKVAYEAERARREKAGIPEMISPCGTALRNNIDPQADWEARRTCVELAAAQLAYLDRKFRDREFKPGSLSINERRVYEHWLYGGPKPPPDPVAHRIRWAAKLFVVLGLLFIGAAVALVVSAVIVSFFHEAGLLAVGIYWLIQWRHWRVLYKGVKILENNGGL
jgi:hypothetical protein